jgi:hypothetical protein
MIIIFIIISLYSHGCSGQDSSAMDASVMDDYMNVIRTRE